MHTADEDARVLEAGRRLLAAKRQMAAARALGVAQNTALGACKLCKGCPGFEPDTIVPSVCVHCSHLGTRHA